MPHLRGIEEGSFDAIGFVLASECGNVVIILALRDVSGCRVNSFDQFARPNLLPCLIPFPHQSAGFLWSLVSAILGVAVGFVLLLWPLSGVLSLTLVLIVFFVIEGVASIMFALEHKRELSGRWGWMLASGIIDLILATIIFAGLPGTAAWAIGLLVGINMVFGGSALIAMALHAREIDPRSAAPAR
jgi:hypothetical protein